MLMEARRVESSFIKIIYLYWSYVTFTELELSTGELQCNCAAAEFRITRFEFRSV